MRFTKGKYAFIVATHTDKAHIHNHVIFNSTSLDGTRKFRNFWLSTLTIQHLSDMICIENGLSVINQRPYRDREKRSPYPKKLSNRDVICESIDSVLVNKPGSFEEFLKELEALEFEIRRGKNISVRRNNQKRFVRLDSLPKGYRQDDLISFLDSNKPRIKKIFQPAKRRISDIIKLEDEMRNKGPGYQRWVSKFNVKQIADTLLYMREHGFESYDEIHQHATDLVAKRDNLQTSVRAAEQRLVEIAALKKYIINYSSTRQTYLEYRKSGYSKKFLEAHREEISLHRAAKEAFNNSGLAQLPKVKDLNKEYAELLTKKKSDYAEYRKVSGSVKEAKTVERNFMEMLGISSPSPVSRTARTPQEADR